MNAINLCFTAECKTTEKHLRDMIRAAESRLANHRGSVEDLNATMRRAQQFVDRNKPLSEAKYRGPEM